MRLDCKRGPQLSRTTPSNSSNSCANAMVELIARSHTRAPPNFSKHAQMCAADNRFAQATKSCQPPQRLSARQHSCLLTSDGVWTSLLGLANNKSPQVCRHLQAQHNNAVHASLVFYWSASVRWATASLRNRLHAHMGHHLTSVLLLFAFPASSTHWSLRLRPSFAPVSGSLLLWRRCHQTLHSDVQSHESVNPSQFLAPFSFQPSDVVFALLSSA